jgi:hypothetical protein
MSSCQQEVQLQHLRYKMLQQLVKRHSMDLLAVNAGQAGTVLLQQAAINGRTVCSSKHATVQPLQAVQQQYTRTAHTQY